MLRVDSAMSVASIVPPVMLRCRSRMRWVSRSLTGMPSTRSIIAAVCVASMYASPCTRKIAWYEASGGCRMCSRATRPSPASAVRMRSPRTSSNGMPGHAN